MADEFQIRSGNWWDPSRITGPSSSSTSFGWSSMDSVSVSGSSSVFGDTHKFQRSDSSAAGGILAADPNLQMMGLGLSSQSMDWNQTLHGSGKAERSFHSLLQEDHMSSNKNYNQESGISSSSISQDQWSQKINSADSDDSLASDFMRTKRGLSLDQPQFVSHDNSTFQMDSSVYGSSSSTMFKGLFGSDDQPQQSGFENPPMNFPYQSSYVMNSGEFTHGQLQFTNNAPFWNASMPAMNNLQSSFFSSLPTPFSTPTFEEKPKNPSQLQDLGTVGKKSNNEPSTKRARSETPSTVPAFNKVRKEKVSDRITALQQLVSPFGKTDTASVLSEAIEYIKFLHEQVNVFSIPYMKSGTSIQHQQSSKKTKDPEGPKQDLRSRGLCLVPVSSTFPVTQESTVDHFWFQAPSQ